MTRATLFNTDIVYILNLDSVIPPWHAALDLVQHPH